MSVIKRLRRETGAAGPPGTTGLVGQFAINLSVADPVLYAAKTDGTWFDVQATVKANVSDLQGRMATAEGSISNLQGRMTAAEGAITTLQSDMAGVQSVNTTQDGRLTTLETNVSNLTTRMTAVEGKTGAATTSVQGIIQLATQAEVTAGTDASKAVTPATLAARLTAFTVNPASETVAGIAEIATSAETSAGTDDARFVTPLKLQQKLSAYTVNAATETVAGIAEIATQAETTTGTDDARFVTPLKLAQKLSALDLTGNYVGKAGAQSMQGPLTIQPASGTGALLAMVAQGAADATVRVTSNNAANKSVLELNTIPRSILLRNDAATDTFSIHDAAAGVTRLSINNAGSWLVNAAVGGQMGPGTLNAKGYYIDGVPLGSSGVNAVGLFAGFSANKTDAASYNSASFVDITGWNEIFDLASDFDPTSGVFTARYTGKYRFSWQLYHDNTATLGDRWEVRITTTARNYSFVYVVDRVDYHSVGTSFLVDMAAGNTAKLQIVRWAGTGVFKLYPDAGSNYFQCEFESAVPVDGKAAASAFSGQLGTALTFNSSTATDVTGWAEIYDVANDFNPSTGVFTARYDGKYRFSFELVHDGSVVVGDRYTFVLLTTARTYQHTYVPARVDFNSVGASWLVDMVAGHTAKLQIKREAGTGAFKLWPDGTFNWFHGNFVAALAGNYVSKQGDTMTGQLLIDLSTAVVGAVIQRTGGWAELSLKNLTAGVGGAALDLMTTSRSFQVRTTDSTGVFDIYDLTAGASRLSINGSGQVGIGVVPGVPFHLYNASYAEARIETGAAAQAMLVWKNTQRMWEAGVHSDGNFLIYDLTAGAQRFWITNAGQVGIGGFPNADTNIRMHVYNVGFCMALLQATANDAGVRMQNNNRQWGVLTQQGGELWCYDYTAGAIRAKIDLNGVLHLKAGSTILYDL